MALPGQVFQRVTRDVATRHAPGFTWPGLSASIGVAEPCVDEAGGGTLFCFDQSHFGCRFLWRSHADRVDKTSAGLGSSAASCTLKWFVLAFLFRATAGFATLREDVLRSFAMSKIQVVSELWEFMRTNKKYWLAPIIITLVLVGALLILAKSSAIAPFIYTLF